MHKSEDSGYLYMNMLPIFNSLIIDELQKEQRKRTEMEEMVKFNKWLKSATERANESN